jgi:starch phosphorylase
VWLNTPHRPLEASGTSGMKAAVNCVLNVSTLDGWWDEAWHDLNPPASPIGWAIGRGETYDSPAEQDRLEADALYDLLERDVVPTFYSRDADRMPRAWIAMMKASISNLVPAFNAQRMVREYVQRCYLPAAMQVQKLSADEYRMGRELADWRERVERNWPGIAIRSVDVRSPDELRVGELLDVRVRVELGELTGEEVGVELYCGRLDANGQFRQARAAPMQLVATEDHCLVFEAQVSPAEGSGLHGYTIRVVPKRADLASPLQPGLVTWAPARAANAGG